VKTVITGPPGAGKTSHARANAQPGDVIIDYDTIATALTAGSITTHDHPAHIRPIAHAARSAAIKALSTLNRDIDVWLIHTKPSPKQVANYQREGWRIVTINPGLEAVLERARRAGRPEASIKAIHDWYSTPTQTASRSAKTTDRGYGGKHQQLRKRWTPAVERGEVNCARAGCGLPILPGEPWDLGHDDYDRSRYSGPEHRECNRGAPGKRRGQQTAAKATPQPTNTRKW
jgi:hypothetical protein